MAGLAYAERIDKEAVLLENVILWLFETQIFKKLKNLLSCKLTNASGPQSLAALYYKDQCDSEERPQELLEALSKKVGWAWVCLEDLWSHIMILWSHIIIHSTF